MRKFTLFLMSLFLSVGAMAQGLITGIHNVPTEKTAPQSLETGYYLLKQANTQANTNKRSAGFIKANSIAVGSNLSTVGNAVDPAAADALNYLWHVTKNNDGTITIATANKEAYWPEPNRGGRTLVGDSEKASLGVVTATTTLGGHTAEPTEGSAMLSNNKQDLAFIHYTESGLGSWTDANPASVWFVEFYEVSVEDLNFEYPHNNQNMNRNPIEEWNRRGLSSFTLIDDDSNSLKVTDIQTLIDDPVYVDKSAQKLITTAGSKLRFSEFNWTGNAMHAYAYIDYNKDYTFNSIANNNGEGNGEVVSYNYYQGLDITGAHIENDATVNHQTYGDSEGMPAFTLPADLKPGEYRMRIKIDWDDLEGNYGTESIANDGGCQCDITLVVVPAPHTLNVTDAGWATLYLGFNAEIPEFTGDKAGAYIVKADDIKNGYITLTQVTGVLPANTGIIVKANAGNYTFNYVAGAAADVEGNLLAGTLEDAVVVKDSDKNYYILANGENGLGLYEPVLGEDKTRFNNAANKAYLVVSAEKSQGIKSFSFRFEGEGTTGIEQMTDNREQSTVVYDLTGRRVEAITAPGIYIVNGKKVLVK